MNLSLSALYDTDNKYYGLKDYNVGYFYNIHEQKYLNCNHITNKHSIQPILTTVPSKPWIIRDLGNTKYVLECSNGQVIDIAWGDSIITYPKHSGWNQQFKLEILDTKIFDKVVIHFESNNVCFTGNLSRIFLSGCENKKNENFGQMWFWIPEEVVKEKLFNVMYDYLNEEG